MSTKDIILKEMMESHGPVSGEKLAHKLGLTRNSVWKAIMQLREEGYQIEAKNNFGYELKFSPDKLSVPGILCWTKTSRIGRELEVHESVSSTNVLGKKLAAQGVRHGYLIAAEAQTQGYGRFGRPFFSPGNAGIYISYVLRPQVPVDRAVMITSMAAVAVARSIESLTDLEVKIKWVNDLYINDLKACGISCEASMDFESTQLEYVVLGIGINVAKIDFPDELSSIATSLGNECDVPVSRNRLIAEISNHLEDLLPELSEGTFMNENRARSNVIGRDVTVLNGEKSYTAHVLDIDDNGRLIIQTGEGITHVAAGEISLKLK